MYGEGLALGIICQISPVMFQCTKDFYAVSGIGIGICYL